MRFDYGGDPMTLPILLVNDLASPIQVAEQAPTKAKGRPPSPVLPRLASKFTVSDGCWEWTGTRTYGYGRFRLRGKYVQAHRLMYELLVGPIPDGLQLDHLCRNRACVRPSHLEPVTQRENILRGEGPTANNATKTHCRYGHEFTPENTYQVKTGGRFCRACARARWHARARAARERARDAAGDDVSVLLVGDAK